MAEVYINLQEGQRKKFEDVDKFKEYVKNYFDDCDSRKAPYTISGLAYWLETSRRMLLDMQTCDHYSNDFKHIVSLAKQRVIAQTEEGMVKGNLNATGCIFTLKNNFGYVDRTETAIDVKDSVADGLEDRRKRVIEATAMKLVE
jgi:hypothetical protein